jgi:Restriction Endonuclease associating with ARP
VKGQYVSYQLIRNVLAAYALGLSLCVILDARRPDLLEAWYAIMRCVKTSDLRTRCQVLTWQELSQTLQRVLQQFLQDKYGVEHCRSVGISAADYNPQTEI